MKARVMKERLAQITSDASSTLPQKAAFSCHLPNANQTAILMLKVCLSHLVCKIGSNKLSLLIIFFLISIQTNMLNRTICSLPMLTRKGHCTPKIECVPIQLPQHYSDVATCHISIKKKLNISKQRIWNQMVADSVKSL